MKILLLPLIIMMSFSSYAASFDCAKASLGIEKTICNVPTLSSLDERMASLYKSSREKAKDPDKIKSDQIAWIKESRRCGNDASCIEAAYKKRIAELEEVGDGKKSTSEMGGKKADFVIMTRTGDREIVYDKNSIIRNGHIAQMITGVNFLNGVKMDNISGIHSMMTLSHFDCSSNRGRNSKGYFYSAANASGNLLSTQTSSDPFADISSNPGLMNLLKIACGK